MKTSSIIISYSFTPRKQAGPVPDEASGPVLTPQPMM